MRSWLLTNTTYGTWLPGDRRGSVTSVRDQRPGDPMSLTRFEHDLPGEPWEDEHAGLEIYAFQLLKGSPIQFTLPHAEIVMKQFRETADHRGWLIRAASIMFNHFHLVVQVPGDPQPKKILADFKAYGTRALNLAYGKPASETWWTTNGSKRKLPTDEAVDNAMTYVLEKQPNPLVLYRATLEDVEKWFAELESRER